MKTDIHPTYFPKAIVTCSCGAKHTVGSTVEKMTVEICSKCHPFYTGKEKLVDTAGRVEKFKSRLKTADDKKTAAKTKKTATKSAKEGKIQTAKKSPKKKIVKTTKRPSVRSKTSAKTKK